MDMASWRRVQRARVVAFNAALPLDDFLHKPYEPGDAIPVPHAVELDTDAAWALWQAMADQFTASFADTVPSVLPEAEVPETPVPMLPELDFSIYGDPA